MQYRFCSLIIILSITAALFLYWQQKNEANSAVASINGVKIYKTDFLKKLQAASVLQLKRNNKDFKNRVLDEMINSELVYQECVRIYGDGLTRSDCINKTLNQDSDNNLIIHSIKERKRSQLDYYNTLLHSLRKKAKINYYPLE